MPFWLAGMSPNNVHIIYIFTFALEAHFLAKYLLLRQYCLSSEHYQSKYQLT